MNLPPTRVQRKHHASRRRAWIPDRTAHVAPSPYKSGPIPPPKSPDSSQLPPPLVVRGRAPPPPPRRRSRAPPGREPGLRPSLPLTARPNPECPRRRSGLIDGVQEDPEGVEGPAEGPSHLLQRRSCG
ncbi:hypothetical protein GUJ93_ZPchr0004g39641 [Zizania palustris]|uniref:Uncharacterized protein n=1 Tax=Zizania palustris TaxID=103762 RepID=A0A8J5VZP9_ZIZPA|nr:hypothetical protein GUJ93_ZPchr0004g39641 [Zizania palustris]